jgi:twitching motility protein PilT
VTVGRISEWSRRLGVALLNAGHLSRDDYEKAAAAAAQRNEPLGKVLVEQGLVAPDVVLKTLSELSNLPIVNLVQQPPDQEALNLLPQQLRREMGIVGYRLEGGTLVLACVEPLGIGDMNTVAGLVGKDVRCVLADERSIRDINEGRVPGGAFTASSGTSPAPASPAPPAPPSIESAAPGGVGRSSGMVPPPPPPPAPPVRPQPAVTGAGLTGGAPQPSGAPVPPGAGSAGPPPVPPPAPPMAPPAVPGVARVAAPPPPPVAPSAGVRPPASATQGPVAASPRGVAQQPPGAPGVAAGAAGGGGVTPMGLAQAQRRAKLEEQVPVMKDINELLIYAVEHGSSDLHITNRLPPAIRVDGAIRTIPGQPPLDNETIREMVFSILPQSLRERFEANKELDTSHSIMGVGRFRVNVFQQRGSVGAVFRAIPHEIPPFESLGLPESVKKVCDLRRGLVLVTGPTGSGKSTTLASLINIINQTRPLHIITIEDPIEFLHTHGRSIVNQREVGTDTKSFAEALRHVLRQDPDVILVGEMRDLETISTALTAAETGHLVFATLHTQDAPQTVDRIIDVFPENQQDQVRVQLAGSLEAVITQQLVLMAGGVGRVAVAEVMFATPAIRNLIRSAKTHQIYSLIQTGAQYGMQTMDQALAKAVKAGLISEGVAFDRCRDENELRNYLRAGL